MPADQRDETEAATPDKDEEVVHKTPEEARQGRIILRSQASRQTFIAGLALFVLLVVIGVIMAA